MSQLGSFELLREINRSPLAVVYAARRAGDAADADGRFAVKAFDAESYGLLESVASAETFLERAALQKSLADQGAKHWARVLELGDADTSYYVTELYPLTAQKVVDRRVVVNHRGLHAVVCGVVRGLTELRETFRRSHGNLKLSNVLIRGDGLKLAGTKSTEVVLVDPSVEANTARDRSADLLAIGELVHQLVLKRPFKPQKSAGGGGPAEPDYPVGYAAAWGKLGPDGRQWLDLCNWLLSPDPADRPNDLVAVAVALHQLAPRQGRHVPRWAAAAGVVLLLGGGAAGTLWHLHGAARAEFAAVHNQWFGAFARALADPGRQQRYAADDTLRSVTTLVGEAGRAGVRLDAPDAAGFSYGRYRNARSALEIAQRVERELTADRWQRLAAVNGIRQRYEARGWAQPAAFLADLAAGARPNPAADLAAGVDRLMDVTSRIGPDAIWLDEQWSTYEADLKAARDAGDPVVAAFAGQLRGSVGATLRLTDAGFDGLDAFKTRLPLAARLAGVVRGGFPRGFGRDRIREEVEAQLNVANPTDADVKQWLDQLKNYELVGLDPEARPLADLGSSLGQLAADVKPQTLTDAERGQYAAERGALEGRLKALADERFVRKHVALSQGDIPGRVGDIQRDLDGLRKKWVRIDDPQQWVKYIDQPLASASDVLAKRWKGYVDAQRKRADELAKNAESFKAAKDKAVLVRDVLAELDKQFPAVPAGLSEQFAAAALERRERDLRPLSDWAEAADASPPADLDDFATRVTDRGEAYKAWCVKLRSLARDFPIAKEMLTPADRPDRGWAAKEKAFWDDAIVQGLVRTDVERISALARVPTLPRPELVQVATDAKAAEVAVAAWRRLGEPAQGAPPWPATPAELDAEQNLRNRLATIINGLKSDADKAAVADEWRAQGPVRWRRFANGAVAATGQDSSAVEHRIETALRYVNSMRINPAEVDRLDPPARFNYALFVARTTLTEGDDAVADAAARQLKAAIDELKDRPEVKHLDRRLARLREPEPMAGDAQLLSASPPETYTLPLGDQSAVKFVRVQGGEVRPFYLATTELSLGQFIDLINSTGNWSAANGLLGNVTVAGRPGPAPLRGPQAWERPSAPNAAIDRLVSWQFDAAGDAAVPAAQPFQFDPSLRQTRFNRSALKPEFGDNPKYDHPMQQLPAQAAVYAAAVVNCRLPTGKEWLAAYDQEQKQAGDPAALDPNLRDATWRMQQAFSEREVPTQWPDREMSGVFWPKGQGRPPTGAAAVRPGDDKTLLFRPVANGSGTFQNLLGNVAEYACDSPDALEALPDRRSADGVRRFCAQHGNTIMVVGGSALSAPDLDPKQPHPVGSPADAYADVGVRLAFTAPARTIAERLKRYVGEQPYLAAAAVAKAGG